MRQGDILLADGDRVLELRRPGSVVKAARGHPRLSRLFGDSYKALSRLDLLTLHQAEATLGVLLGLIPIPRCRAALPSAWAWRAGRCW
ncbi:MAG: hypothetical protein R3A10_02825 [Caldilineaceae bacterium]